MLLLSFGATTRQFRVPSAPPPFEKVFFIYKNFFIYKKFFFRFFKNFPHSDKSDSRAVQ